MEKLTACSYDMEGHAEECVERYCELAQKDVSTQQQVATLCMDDHLIPLEVYENNRRALCGMCSDCPEVPVPGKKWSVNTLAQSETKWNKASDRRWLIFINYISQTKNERQLCHVVHQIKDCQFSNKISRERLL